jgi:hypothetical protein
MSKERYNQIIDEVYENYSDAYEKDNSLGRLLLIKRTDGKSTYRKIDKDTFIVLCTQDKSFSERWGLKIEEQMLSEERRYNIWFNNNYETGMERFFNPEQLPDYHNPYYTPTPTKEITVSYNGEKISFYE